MKSAKKKKPHGPAVEPRTMTTAEATVATLIAHGLDTVYALPGVHNDHLFDAFQHAGDALRVVHTRHEQGAAYMALGAALATGKPQAYSGRAGPGPAQFRRRAAHRLWHERSRPGADRSDSGAGHRARPRPSARDPRSGRHHRPAGRSLCPHQGANGRRRQDRQGAPFHAARPAGPGRARMCDRCLGPTRARRRHCAAQAAARAAHR